MRYYGKLHKMGLVKFSLLITLSILLIFSFKKFIVCEY